MSTACFDTLIGLSKVDFACFTDAAPTGYDTSDSGYHITDTDYGLTIASQCALDGWTILEAARTQAILEVKSDLRAALRERYDGGISPFSGIIASLKSTGTNTVTEDFIGLRIRTKNQKGAKLVLKKIYLGLNTTGIYSVTITSNDPLWVPPTATSIVIATANTMTAAVLSTAIELPLFSRTCEERYLEYYICLDRAGALPVNNNVTCCGNRPNWMDHLTVTGMQASDNEATDGSYTSAAYGMALDAYLACEELDWLCEAQYLNGFHLQDVLARTFQFRATAIAISALIDTLLVNPCTGYQIESLSSRRQYLNQRAADNIVWISQNVPNGLTDCFVCKPEKMFHRSLSTV